MKRLEHLTTRRPELLSSVMLRQNPHNVHEWHKRMHLFPENPTRQILVYTEAVKTVDSDKARFSALMFRRRQQCSSPPPEFTAIDVLAGAAAASAHLTVFDYIATGVHGMRCMGLTGWFMW